VYTLTVAFDHDFFVGSAGVLVHNALCPRIWQQVSGDFPTTGARPDTVLIRRDPATGAISNYAVYDPEGTILYRVDITGRAHHGVPTPHVHYYYYSVDPATGERFLTKDPEAYPGQPWQLTPPK
jgi:hypothetical protein